MTSTQSREPNAKKVVMKSSFASRCFKCRKRISKGESIVWFPEKHKARHEVCPLVTVKGALNSGRTKGGVRFNGGR